MPCSGNPIIPQSSWCENAPSGGCFDRKYYTLSELNNYLSPAESTGQSRIWSVLIRMRLLYMRPDTSWQILGQTCRFITNGRTCWLDLYFANFSFREELERKIRVYISSNCDFATRVKSNLEKKGNYNIKKRKKFLHAVTTSDRNYNLFIVEHATWNSPTCPNWAGLVVDYVLIKITLIFRC